MNKNARVIYKRLTEPMKKRGYINLNHRLVNTKDDLVEIAESGKLENPYRYLGVRSKQKGEINYGL